MEESAKYWRQCIYSIDSAFIDVDSAFINIDNAFIDIDSAFIDCIVVVSREPITKDIILMTEYERRQRIRVSVFEVNPLIVRGEHLAVYLTQYSKILAVSSDCKCR